MRRSGWLLLVTVIGCGASDDEGRIGTIVDKFVVSLGKDAQTIVLHRGSKLVEVEFPATTAERRGQVVVQLVENPPQRGAMLADGLAVNIATRSLTFAPPAQLRQEVTSPAPGRQHVAVHAEPHAQSWMQRGPALPGRPARSTAARGPSHAARTIR